MSLFPKKVEYPKAPDSQAREPGSRSAQSGASRTWVRGLHMHLQTETK